MSEELQLAGKEGLAIGRYDKGLTIEQVFDAVLEKKLRPEDVKVVKELLAMDAARRFDDAFVALQADLPVIVASTVIPNRGKYEKFEDIMKVVGPILTRHKFTATFSQDVQDGRIVEICHLSHGGHTRSNPFAVRPGKADTETQADCKAGTTAKRMALCNALNIIIRQDIMTGENDAAIEGSYITPEQSKELQKRVFETGSDVMSFLKFAGVIVPPNSSAEEVGAAFGRIASGKLGLLDKSLRKKESTK